MATVVGKERACPDCGKSYTVRHTKQYYCTACNTQRWKASYQERKRKEAEEATLTGQTVELGGGITAQRLKSYRVASPTTEYYWMDIGGAGLLMTRLTGRITASENAWRVVENPKQWRQFARIVKHVFDVDLPLPAGMEDKQAA